MVHHGHLLHNKGLCRDQVYHIHQLSFVFATPCYSTQLMRMNCIHAHAAAARSDSPGVYQEMQTIFAPARRLFQFLDLLQSTRFGTNQAYYSQSWALLAILVLVNGPNLDYTPRNCPPRLWTPKPRLNDCTNFWFTITSHHTGQIRLGVLSWSHHMLVVCNLKFICQ